MSDIPEPIPAEPIPHDLDRAAWTILEAARFDRKHATELFLWLVAPIYECKET